MVPVPAVGRLLSHFEKVAETLACISLPSGSFRTNLHVLAARI